jgi:hypothetical protein
MTDYPASLWSRGNFSRSEASEDEIWKGCGIAVTRRSTTYEVKARFRLGLCCTIEMNESI